MIKSIANEIYVDRLENLHLCRVRNTDVHYIKDISMPSAEPLLTTREAFSKLARMSPRSMPHALHTYHVVGVVEEYKLLESKLTSGYLWLQTPSMQRLPITNDLWLGLKSAYQQVLNQTTKIIPSDSAESRAATKAASLQQEHDSVWEEMIEQLLWQSRVLLTEDKAKAFLQLYDKRCHIAQTFPWDYKLLHKLLFNQLHTAMQQ